MSTGDPNQNGAVGGEGNESPVESQGAPAPSTQPPGEQQQQEDPDSLANGFLKNIPELDRQVVAKYVKDWDAGVTRKFQEIHSQYEPYKQLQADPAELQAAYEIYQQLNSDPQAFYQALANALEVETQQPGQQQQQQQQQFGQQQDPNFEGLPPQFVQQFQQQQQVLEAMANWIIGQQTSTQQQQEDQELDNYLNQLRQQHGEFDESYVLSKMYAEGLTGEQAIQAWQQAVQGYVNQNAGAVGQQQGGFKPLHGGGSVPNDEKKVTELSPKETKELVASVLQQQAEGQ